MSTQRQHTNIHFPWGNSTHPIITEQHASLECRMQSRHGDGRSQKDAEGGFGTDILMGRTPEVRAVVLKQEAFGS